jgi:hypothetical protein
MEGLIMSKYDRRKENFIRKYAITKNISESESRKWYREVYEKSSDKQRRSISKRVNKAIKERSSPVKVPSSERDTSKGFKYPKPKQTQTVKGRKKQVRNIQIIKQQTQGHKTQKRVIRASIKYPNASKYELQHGVNSVASQKYRERHK